MTKNLLCSGGYGSKILSCLNSKNSPVLVSISDLGKKITALDFKVSAVEEGQSELKKKCDCLKQTNSSLYEEVQDIQSRLQDSNTSSTLGAPTLKYGAYR